MKILQIAYGQVIPDYISAYSLRCYNVINNYDKELISVGGLILRDKKVDNIKQYHSLLLTGMSILKGNRSLEIFISQNKYLRKKYVKDLRNKVINSDIIMFEGIWEYPLVKDILDNKIVIYDAHNVEYLLRKNNVYKDICYRIENEILHRANIVLSVTNEDISNIIKIYDINKEKIYYIPHIIKISNNKWNGLNSNHIVFIGSMYKPNIEALNYIIKLANKLPNFIFDIIGNIKIFKTKIPKNVIFHKTVTNEEKDNIMNNCFLAINPVINGSGRNLKMIDYLAHELPIISTPIGIRGLTEYNTKDCIFNVYGSSFYHSIIYIYNNKKLINDMHINSNKLYNDILQKENITSIDEILKEYL